MNTFPPVPFKVKIKYNTRTPSTILPGMGDEQTVVSVSKEGCLFKLKGLECLGWFHHSHFTIVQEGQKEVKYKVVPFSVEMWEKYRDDPRLKVYINGKQCKRFMPMVNNNNKGQGHALYTIAIGEDEHVCSMSVWVFTLHIPLTTCIIPFDPSRKDAKVLVKESCRIIGQPREIEDWYLFSNGKVGCTYKGFNDIFGIHPAYLEMEVEEA